MSGSWGHTAVWREGAGLAAQRVSEGTSESRPSPVVTAVLALVIERPSYGYELSQRFDERFGALYPVSRSRIYQVLDQLLRNGLIEQMPFADARQSLRQPRPHYRATAEGARLHREWMAAAIQEDPRREELLRRLLATSARDARAMLQIVDIYERTCLNDMARRDRLDIPPDPGDGPGSRLRDLLIAEEQRLVHETRLKFIAAARRHINAEIDETA
jgi:DNA-binding PadR family transcriptional regulator